MFLTHQRGLGLAEVLGTRNSVWLGPQHKNQNFFMKNSRKLNPRDGVMWCRFFLGKLRAQTLWKLTSNPNNTWRFFRRKFPDSILCFIFGFPIVNVRAQTNYPMAPLPAWAGTQVFFKRMTNAMPNYGARGHWWFAGSRPVLKSKGHANKWDTQRRPKDFFKT